jgi:hypothetical protein
MASIYGRILYIFPRDLRALPTVQVELFKSSILQRDLLELWQTLIPELLPDYYCNWEPIDRPFDRQNIDAALDQWKWGFLIVRKHPFVDAQVWMRKGV